MSSRLTDINNRIIELQARTQEATGTVNKFPAYLGKSMTDPTIQVQLAVAEYPSAQLVYFYTMDTNSSTSLQTRAFGSAHNPDGYAQFGLPVWVAKHLESGLFVIVGRRDDDAGFYAAAGDISPTGQAHGESHYLYGPGAGGVADPTFISTRQIRDGGVFPTSPLSLSVQVVCDGSIVPMDGFGQPDGAASTTLDLTSRVPGTPGEARWVAVYWNIATGGTFSLNNGDTFVASATIASDVASAKLAQIPFPNAPIGWVYLQNGQTTIDYEHIRRWALVGPSGRHFHNPNSSYLDGYDDDEDYNIVLAGPIQNYSAVTNAGIIKVI